MVSRQLPDRQGTAPGKALLALGEGLVAEGHRVAVWSWRPEPPECDLPPWCTWRPLPPEAAWRTRLRALAWPRSDVLVAEWSPPPGAVPVADDVPSFGAVAASKRSVVTLHHRAGLDHAALGRRDPGAVQDRRAERRAARRARVVLAYSPRAGSTARGRARFVPIAYPVPEEVVDPVAGPVALLLADWRWPPNLAALGRLMLVWPDVRRRVAGAKLLLAGRDLDRVGVGAMAGVEVLGPLARAEAALSRAAVVAFPCPDTTGPKVKVLEALAYGVPVVTTSAGVEGLLLGPLASELVADGRAFGERLAELLEAPETMAELGARGRAAVSASHAPRPAARARVAALRSALGEPGLNDPPSPSPNP